VRRVAHIEPHAAEWPVAAGVRRKVPPHLFPLAAAAGIESQDFRAFDHRVEQKFR